VLVYNTYYNQQRKVVKMTLEEYKAHVEAQRKASLLKAIATMSEANATMGSLFNTKEAN
jgi:hypothetical protein